MKNDEKLDLNSEWTITCISLLYALHIIFKMLTFVLWPYFGKSGLNITLYQYFPSILNSETNIIYTREKNIYGPPYIIKETSLQIFFFIL